MKDAVTEHHLLGALYRDGQPKIVNTMHRFSRRITAVKRKCQESCYVITGVAGMLLDSARQNVDC